MQFRGLGAGALIALGCLGAAPASADDAVYLGVEAADASLGEPRGDADISNKRGNSTSVVLGYSFNRTFEIELAQRKVTRLIIAAPDISQRFQSKPKSATALMLQWVRPVNDYVGLGLRAGVVRATRSPGNIFGQGERTGNSLVLGVTGRLMLTKNVAVVVGADRTSNYTDADMPLMEYRLGVRGYF